MSLLSRKLNINVGLPTLSRSLLSWRHNVFFSPVDLWDHALQHRTWTIRVDANTSQFAVDGNSSTLAKTFPTAYPFLAVDLSVMLQINYAVLNIKQGKLCTFIIVNNTNSTVTQIVELAEFLLPK